MGQALTLLRDFVPLNPDWKFRGIGFYDKTKQNFQNIHGQNNNDQMLCLNSQVDASTFVYIYICKLQAT